MIGVSDLLLGVRLSFCLGGPPPPPLIHLLSICFCSRKLREETGGVLLLRASAVVPRPEGIHTLSSKSDPLLVCVRVCVSGTGWLFWLEADHCCY